uniref:Sorting nexin 14 n=1 Tax=Homo sapiens TaxID=9606 RepID=A0A804HJD1_HUMAN
MIFWSFVAGVVTFYCSLGPDSLLPNIFFTIKYKPKQLGLQELFPQGHSCAVCGKVKCKRHRPSLLLENYQPWLDLKISSKVDASLSEVLELVLENFVYPWYSKKYRVFTASCFRRIWSRASCCFEKSKR